MIGVRVLDLVGIGEREAPAGSNLRREQTGEGDRFRSVLARVAGSVERAASSLEREEAAATGRGSNLLPDGRLRKSEAGEERPTADRDIGDDGARHVTERPSRILRNRLDAERDPLQQIGALPDRPAAEAEPIREPGVHPRILAAAPPLDDGMVAASDAARVDLPPSAAPAVAVIASPNVLPEASDAPGNEPVKSFEIVEVSRSVAFGRSQSETLDVAPPAATSGVLSDKRAELNLPLGDDVPLDVEAGFGPPPELPRMTVISRESHLAPAGRRDPAWSADPPSVSRPDASDRSAKEEVAATSVLLRDVPTGAVDKEIAVPDPRAPSAPMGLADDEIAVSDMPLHGDRVAPETEPQWMPFKPGLRPKNNESGAPRQVSAGIAPSVAAAFSSSASAATSPDTNPTPPPAVQPADQRLALQSAPIAELPRAAVISQDKSSAPSRRLDPARPAAPEPDQGVEPSHGSSTGLAPARPIADGEEVALGPRPASEKPSSPTIIPDTMPPTARRGEDHTEPSRVVPAAASGTMSSTESVLIPTGGTAGGSQDIVQRISGAVVEAVNSGAPSAASPVAASGIENDAPTSAPARALTIRIDLQEHGAVHVRLALSGSALSLRLRADREDIAEQLRQDQVKLADTLSAAGYDTEILAIEGKRGEIAQPLPGSDASSPTASSTDGAALADRGSGGENRRPPARQIEVPNREFGENALPHDQEDHESRHIAQRRPDALYV